MAADAPADAFDLEAGTVTLNNGVEMPVLGFGTWQVKGEVCTEVVKTALGAGFRHIDTASIYRNEAAVAAGIAAAGVPREELWITSKLSPGQQGEDAAYAACEASLAALGTTYLDLYLVHWPGVKGHKPSAPEVTDIRNSTWLALQRLLKEGKVRAIGVSNYMPLHLESLAGAPGVTVTPALNQFELHPLLPNADAVAACRARGIAVQAYAPLAQGAPALLQAPALMALAKKHDTTAAVAAIAWGLAKGYVQIPRSTSAAHLAENFTALALARLFSAEDVASLSDLEDGEGGRQCWNPNSVTH